MCAAQDYPARPIGFVVPFPASGGGDIIIRALSHVRTHRLRALAVTTLARSIFERLNKKIVDSMRGAELRERLITLAACRT